MALWQLMHLGMYGYSMLVPMNQRVLNKLNKEHNINVHKWSTTHRVLKSHRWKMSLIACLACWALFVSLVPAMCNRTSSTQVHELPESHCGDNREGTLFLWLHIYYAHFVSVRFEYSVCHGLLMTIYIMLFA